jgi:hypothetical protein
MAEVSAKENKEGEFKPYILLQIINYMASEIQRIAASTRAVRDHYPDYYVDIYFLY